MTAHQAVVLEKKIGIVKRYSATEAMLIHAAAASRESLHQTVRDPPPFRGQLDDSSALVLGQTKLGQRCSSLRELIISKVSDINGFKKAPSRDFGIEVADWLLNTI